MTNTYELRTYQAVEGKMDQLLARFRDHTVALFADHNIESVGYWVSKEDPNRLIYLVRHLGDPEENWTAFRADERWITARAESEANGPLAESIVAVRLDPADFSQLQ